ncbi:hypothetical protein R6Q59_025266 [Mikania micrantha]
MEYIPKHVLCSCGYPATIHTSWTSTNPGRRFYCCARNVVVVLLGGGIHLCVQDLATLFRAFLERTTCMRKLLGGLVFKTVV